MKISLLQMNSQPDRRRNLDEAHKLMREAVERDRPDLLVLPEHFDWSGGSVQDKRNAADAVPGGEAYRLLQAFAADHKVAIHAGSILERINGSQRIHNTTVIFDALGRQIGTYRKLHLFDITAPDGKEYRESASVERGGDLLIYELDGWRIGCAICYDLRFSRLFDRLAAHGVDIFVLPAAFTMQTGKAHWEVLCRARAIEFQAYFVACGQWGSYPAQDGEIRHTYGNSLVCDPWGNVVARAKNEVGVTTVDIRADRIAEIRNLIPMARHRLDFGEVVPVVPSV